jgi:hypothetical protein
MTNATKPAATTTQHGSCHCGAVHFEVDIDATSATQCNCTICRKINGVTTSVKHDAFRLLQGQDTLTTYANRIGARYFCKVCGIHVYGDGDLPEMGGAFVSVNFNTFDAFDVADVEVSHWDGLHDNWHAGLRPSPWPRVA